jgi:glycosyltransferase involved in cell wall biosynthesis
MSTKVLYLSYDGMTDSLGQSQVLPYLIGLTKKGFSFHIISFEKSERFQQYRATIQGICDENNIHWHPLTYTKKPPLLSTMYDVRRMRNLSKGLHKIHNFKIVHCRSYLSAMIGQHLQKKEGIKFLFDMRGFWADERVEGKIWSLSNPVFKTVYDFFKRKEKQFFLEADFIISLTHAGKKEIISWKGFEHLASKIEVIPCCVDLEKFDPKKITKEQIAETKEHLELCEDTKILGYVGSIGTWYMLDEMLQFFKRYRAQFNCARFLFVTGEKREVIVKRAKDFGIDEADILVRSVLHHEVPRYISLFDASVFFIIPTFSKKASSPTKQGELMAMKIPIYCNDNVGDTGEVIRQYNAGKVVSIEDPSFSNCDLEMTNFQPEKAMFGAQEFYGLEGGTNRYLKVYHQLLN